VGSYFGFIQALHWRKSHPAACSSSRILEQVSFQPRPGFLFSQAKWLRFQTSAQPLPELAFLAPRSKQ